MGIRVAAKAVGIDQDAKSRHHPDDLKARALEAITPLDPFFEEDPTVKEWLLEQRPTLAGTLRYITSLFPFVRWIGHYNLQWLMGDVIGGKYFSITLGFVVVPQAMAYAILAGLRPEFGLYTSFTGATLYWLFGTSKDIAIGATAVVSLLVGRIIETVRAEHPQIAPEEVSKTIAALSGCFLLLFGMLRLDWLIEFIPHVAISAFVTGASITITISQMPTVLGIAEKINTRDAPYAVFVNTCKALPKATVGAAVGLTAILILHAIKSFCARMAVKQKHKAKMWDTISSVRMTFVILLYTLISFIVNRGLSPQEAKFKILGPVPTGFKAAGTPSFNPDLVKLLAPELPALLIILIIEHIAIGKSFARLNNYTVVPSQEIISIGAANLLGPFLGGYPATGSFTGTAVLSKAGVRTPLAGVFNGLILLLALYALTSVFYFIPSAALAGLIVHAVSNLITPPATLIKYWQLAPLDVFIYFVGVFFAVFLSLETGIYATVGLSFLILLLRIARSQGRFLGRARMHVLSSHSDDGGRRHSEASEHWEQRLPSQSPQPSGGLGNGWVNHGREVFLPLDRRDGSNPAVDVGSVYPGVFIYRFTEGCNYLNQAQCVDHIVAHVTAHTRKTNTNEYKRPGDRPWNEPAVKKTNQPSDYPNENSLPLLRAIICDFSTVNHVDSSAVEGLMDMRAQLDRWAAPAAVEWHLAGVRSRWTRRALVAAGFGYPSAVTSGGFWIPGFDVGATTSPGNIATVAAEVHREHLVNHAGKDCADIADARTRVNSLEDLGDCELGLGDRFSSSGTATPGSVTGHQRHVCSEGQAGACDGASRGKYAPVFGIDRPFFHVDLVSAASNAVESARWRDKIGETGQC
ncbi:hypothetical protein PpBr36_03518 [Pyricularia pennisetigena]|uniref:hypothetical protein n=1 Tax=Pyricularia pennisetigena TaxID=1578925 RepID=UPI001151038C|nr:hypothetical protein PpBr36_03518 [Pyricularia pennisetigena]TLS30913.1 hypothetical protein PpBr36_03518 [Pyricularia pennisetigena]